MLETQNAHKISLDNALIAKARRLITGANVHRVKQLIFIYEQSVRLYNAGWPAHRVYQSEHEQALRNFVMNELLQSSSRLFISDQTGA